MNEGYSEITQIISQIKKKKIELEALLGKHNDDIFTKKIMNAILKVEGLISKAKKLQMSIDVKGYTTSHKVSSGILHSKLLKEINQIKKQEQEINETKFGIEKLIAETPKEKWKKSQKKPKSKSKPKANSNDSWEVIDIPFHTEEEDQDQTGEELISYAKTSPKTKAEKTSSTTKDHYKPFSNNLSQIEKRNSLEVQEMISQFRKIRSDLDSMLSSYRGQKYRKKIMDSIIKIKASINTLLSMQSSFKVAKSSTINHSATINRAQFEKQIALLKKEKKEMLEKLKILKAKVAKEKREIVQQSYETKKTFHSSPKKKTSNTKDEKDPAMVNILLKMGVLKKKNKDK
ncbi:hypothetical protein [Candidatus Uabimicrobium amorphum]|uniref:Uncharacterized protein n=1 Tax=Uabimicrobium amorphum TaxID=2596890 RepID=A0A5S9F1I6_UABAM|nr:hypothetical protein [Candidatus Uabimicrobium amorphum]BBM82231.1 hypothetical protein UABAM_00574 [Candidatus Uabimicrobium amorphum]